MINCNKLPTAQAVTRRDSGDHTIRRYHLPRG